MHGGAIDGAGAGSFTPPLSYCEWEERAVEALRSLLFVPGNRREMLQKALNLPADALVPDLEDSVPAGEKENARRVVQGLLPILAQGGRRVIPRVNALSTGLARDDLAAVIGHHTYGISIGKLESARDVRQVSVLIGEMEGRAGVPDGQTRLALWLENARAIVFAYELCSASPRVVAVALGAEDFTDDMDMERTDQGTEFLYARSVVAVAARAADVLALDTPYVNFRDPEGLERDTRLARNLGYKGKFAIHPSQIEPINRIFTPDAQEVEYARRVLKAWDEAEAQGRGSTSVDGKVIDVPMVKRARSLLALSEAIGRRESQGRG